MKLTEKNKFIIKRGVLGQGFLTALIYIIINVLIDGVGNLRNFILKCIVSIIIFTALGHIWGLMMWKSKLKDNSNKKDKTVQNK